LEEAGQVALLDSRLVGAGDPVPAIHAPAGSIFLRDVNTEAYSAALIGARGVTVPVGMVTECALPEALADFEGTKPRSLNLPWVEAPVVPWTRESDAAFVLPSGDDDTEGLQKALDSGRATV